MKDSRATADKVEPTEALSVSADEADNRFLECAKAAGADDIVAGNRQHFPDTFGRTRIISPRQLIELVTPRS
jgi:predicted nucleic acid-binding protein